MIAVITAVWVCCGALAVIDERTGDLPIGVLNSIIGYNKPAPAYLPPKEGSYEGAVISALANWLI